MRMAWVMAEEVLANYQACLAVALIAPVGERPVIELVGAAEGQGISHPVTVQQQKSPQYRVQIQGIDHDHVPGPFQGRTLTAKGQDVRDRGMLAAVVAEDQAFPDEKISNRDVLRFGFQQGSV